MTLDPGAVRLDGLVAVVTGGGAGIGRGIAAGLHAIGADAVPALASLPDCGFTHSTVSAPNEQPAIKDRKPIFEKDLFQKQACEAIAPPLFLNAVSFNPTP